jgi:hypothetical protein
LDPHHSRLDEAPERYDTDDDADDVGNIVTVLCNIADTATVTTSMFVSFKRTREGLCDKVTFEPELWRRQGRLARSVGKDVNKLEDEVAWESATEIGDAGSPLVIH